MRRVGADIVRDEQVFEIKQLVSLQLSLGQGPCTAVPDGLDVGQIDQAVRCKVWIDQDVEQPPTALLKNQRAAVNFTRFIRPRDSGALGAPSAR